MNREKFIRAIEELANYAEEINDNDNDMATANTLYDLAFTLRHVDRADFIRAVELARLEELKAKYCQVRIVWRNVNSGEVGKTGPMPEREAIHQLPLKIESRPDREYWLEPEE